MTGTAVSVFGDGGTLFVQYEYVDGASGGVAKYVRLDHAHYPNNRGVYYAYGTAGSADDIMSRLTAIHNGWGNTYASYTYLGAGQIVAEVYEDLDLSLDYTGTSNSFSGFDRFGRVVDQVWRNWDEVVIDRYTYTYDRAGNRMSKTNVLDSVLSETYQYDDLARLIAYSVNGTQQKTWSLDALGNNLAAGTYNAANEETPTVGSSAYDLAGNMTTLQNGDTAIYDAWNRMVEVDDGEDIVQKNEYDGTNRRIQIFSDFTGSTPDTVQDDYLSGQQVIESDLTSGSSPAGGYQFIYSLRYIDAAILRDTLTTDRTGIVAAQRIFYLSDANYNVTGLLKYDSGEGKWTVAERYTYTPYGVVTYRNADWSTTGSSANANTILYTGRTLDLLTSLYYYRARYYDAALERFISRDPIGLAAGDANLYRYVRTSPIGSTDATGRGDSGGAMSELAARIKAKGMFPDCEIPYQLQPEQEVTDLTIVKVFRGGRLPTTEEELRKSYIDLDKDNCVKNPKRGLSLNTDPGLVVDYGPVIVITSILPELKIVQQGKDSSGNVNRTHCELVPRNSEPKPSAEQLLEWYKQVKTVPLKGY